MKKLVEFNNINTFLKYKEKYMLEATLTNKKNCGESELVIESMKGAVLGVWKPRQNYGYIKEGRGEKRLEEERDIRVEKARKRSLLFRRRYKSTN